MFSPIQYIFITYISNNNLQTRKFEKIEEIINFIKENEIFEYQLIKGVEVAIIDESHFNQH